MPSHRFTDFDAFAASVRGVDCRMMLQNAKTRSWDINVVDVGAIQVQLGRLGSGNIVEGESYSDRYMMYLPLTGDCEYSWNATVLQKYQMAILEPGCEFCVSTKHEHDWCTIAVSTELLVDRITNGKPPECRVSAAKRSLSTRFREAVQGMLSAAAAYPQFESRTARSGAETELLNIAEAVLGLQRPNEENRGGRPQMSRKEIIQRSIDLLEAPQGPALRMPEVASAVGVSERTLRAAFVEYFGIGPNRYLQLRKLHQVNRALRLADPGFHSVTQVLAEHGEWQFGRFATRYRRHFGESPSQTLDKAG